VIRLALTGSIGMGKSTVAAMFARAGVPVFDADSVVRKLQGPGGALVPRIEKRFPGTTRNGTVDRDLLAAHVLSNPEELAALEAIVHPAVHHERTRFIIEHGDSPVLLFEIPLLFETGGAEAFDKIIVVSAPAGVQRERVMARPGMTNAKFEALLTRQTSDEEKRKLADFVIDTGSDLSTTESQVRNVLTCLGLASGD
jgi:dephospho-CoA kinase